MLYEVITTTEIHKVPATIRSRCQQFNFRLVDLSEIKRLLETVCNEIAVKFDDDVDTEISNNSRHPKRAVSMGELES